MFTRYEHGGHVLLLQFIPYGYTSSACSNSAKELFDFNKPEQRRV